MDRYLRTAKLYVDIGSRLWSPIVLTCLLIGVVANQDVSAQTISLDQRTKFIAKFTKKDSTKSGDVDLSRIVEWRLDSAGGISGILKPAFALESRKYLWTALEDSRFPAMPDYGSPQSNAGIILHQDSLAFFFLYNGEGACVLLTTWDLIGKDRIRFKCAITTDFYPLNSALWIEKTVRFPDSSLLIYVRSSNVNESRDGGCDWYCRWSRSCELQLVYKTQWAAVYPLQFCKITYDSQELSEHNYVVIERIDFGRLVGDPYGHDMQRDSSTARELDLWDMAIKRPGIDKAGPK